MGDETPEKERLPALEKQMAASNTAIAKLTGLVKQLLLKESPEKPKETNSESEEEQAKTGSDDEFDTASKTSQQEGRSSFRNLKIDFKIEVPMYDGSVNVDKLDDWIERLDTYFTFHRFTSQSYRRNSDEEVVSWKQFKELLRKKFYPVGFLEERWHKWHNLRQKTNQSVEDYTTEFQNQAMVLDISLKEYSVFMKYEAGLHEYLQRELRLFMVQSVEDASVKAITIKKKFRKNETKGDGKQTGGKSNDSYAKTEEHKNGVSDGKACLVCSYCEGIGHVADKCWVKFPYLKPRVLRHKEERKKTTLITNERCYLRKEGSEQKYTFTKDGQRFVIRATSLPPEASLVAATQAKRLVNACRKFVLLTCPHEGHSSQDVEKTKLKKSQAKYKIRSCNFGISDLVWLRRSKESLKEDPLPADCILEQQVATTRRGECTVFRIGRAGQEKEAPSFTLSSMWDKKPIPTLQGVVRGHVGEAENVTSSPHHKSYKCLDPSFGRVSVFGHAHLPSHSSTSGPSPNPSPILQQETNTHIDSPLQTVPLVTTISSQTRYPAPILSSTVSASPSTNTVPPTLATYHRHAPSIPPPPPLSSPVVIHTYRRRTQHPSPSPAAVAPSPPVASSTLPEPSTAAPEPSTDPPPSIAALPLPMQTRSRMGNSKPKASQSQEWRTAMAEEINDILKNQTWTLVPPSPTQNTVGWVSELNILPTLLPKDSISAMALTIMKHSVRLSSLPRFAVIAIAVSKGWSLSQLDVKNAFYRGFSMKMCI
ncbi:PREDICTED: uncharacterized protein LOC101306573 [Fragaria vesca subsp. vesca]